MGSVRGGDHPPSNFRGSQFSSFLSTNQQANKCDTCENKAPSAEVRVFRCSSVMTPVRALLVVPRGTGIITAAPITLQFACRDPAAIIRILLWKFQRRQGVKFCSGTDPFLEVVSGPRYWWTAARSRGMSIAQSDNWLKLMKRNFPQSIVTWPNKSNVVAVTVFGNLDEENKYHSCSWRSFHPPVCPPTRPTDISAKKRRLSPAKHFNSPSVFDENKSLWPSALLTKTSGNFPPENNLHPREWVRQVLFTDGAYVIMTFSVKNVTLSLSRMFSGSGSQSLHIITASIWL